MALIKSLKDVKDLKPVEGGNEHDLRILKAKATKSNRTGRNGVLLVIDITDEDYAPNIMHTLWFGNDGVYTNDEEETSELMWRMVKEFIRSIGLDPDLDLEADDFKDVEFSAIVEYDDGAEYDDEGNVIAQHMPRNTLGKILG